MLRLRYDYSPYGSESGDAGRASAPNILLLAASVLIRRSSRGVEAALLLSCESPSRLRVVLATGAADRFGALATRAARVAMLAAFNSTGKRDFTRLILIGIRHMASRALMTHLIP